MPIVAKDLQLTRIPRERETLGKRNPLKDAGCPDCHLRGRETITFAYDLTLPSGKSDIVYWCSYQRKEVSL